MVQPAPIVTADVEFIPGNDKATMTWYFTPFAPSPHLTNKTRFTNVPCGTPISKNAVSADNSLQLMIGYENYVAWREKDDWEQGGKKGPQPIDRRPIHRRQGPKIEF